MEVWHVHRILIFIKYLIMTGSFYAPVTKLILDRIIPISPQVNIFIFTYQECKIKGTICILIEYDRTSCIVLKNF